MAGFGEESEILAIEADLMVVTCIREGWMLNPKVGYG